MENSQKFESRVKGYVRSFPTTFMSAEGSTLKNEHGKTYIDFLAGAGSLNYGHNNPLFKKALLNYVENNGITHGLDMATQAKEKFISVFDKYILKPRGLNYKLQFTGPTGTNSVEAAIKLAQLVTRRVSIISFSNAYHGHSKGSLRVTAGESYRKGLENDLNQATTFMPYYGYINGNFSSLDYLEKALTDKGSGIDKPAAIILETIQGEGGVNIAPARWLQQLRRISEEHGILLIIDDIQVGCGRTGKFFSFERSGIVPDMITLSKSLSGYGLPMSLLLLKPELDKWEPGQHTGTFRGNNLAFVTATEAILNYWKNDEFESEIALRSEIAFNDLDRLKRKFPEEIAGIRGKGLILAIEFKDPKLASEVSKTAFENNLIVETCGAEGNILKILPPLNIEIEHLEKGINILENVLEEVLISV